MTTTTPFDRSRNVSFLFQRASNHAENNRFSDGLADCLSILDIDSTYLDALVFGGRLAFTIGNYETAVSLFNRAIEIDKSAIQHYYFFARSLCMIGKNEEAWNAIKLVFTSNSENISSEDFVKYVIDLVYSSEKSQLAKYRKHFELIGSLLQKIGIHASQFDDLSRHALSRSTRVALSPARILCVLAILGFNKENRIDLLTSVFTRYLVPTIKRAVDEKEINLALQLESLVYNYYIKKNETEKHFRFCFDQYTDTLRLAGNLVAEHARGTENNTKVDGELKIGLFVQQASTLAHVEVMLALLSGWSQIENRGVIPIVYVMFGYDKNLEQRVRACGVDIYFFEIDRPQYKNDIVNSFVYLRSLLRDHRVLAVVFVSLAMHMPFAVALRLAPVQIWWAMKYHSLDLPELDGYFTNGSFEKKRLIDGKSWRVVHSALDRLYDTKYETEAARIRGQYGQDVTILASMGREEKIETTEFLDTIASILKARQKTVYLWTGRVKSAMVASYFENAGLADRCHFIGWIDTRLYAQVLDIYIDSFPFGGGHTIFQSWAVSKPAVMMLTRETLETGVPMHVLPAYNGEIDDSIITNDVKRIFTSSHGENLSMIAKSNDEYIEMALRLIDDNAYRAAAAKAAKAFTEKYMCNRKMQAESFCKQVEQLLHEKSTL